MTLLWVVVLFVLLEGFFSGSETGAYRLNRVRLRRRIHEGRADAIRLGRLMKEPQRFVCMTLAGTNVSVYGATAIVTYLLAPLTGRYSGLAATLALSPVLLVVAEVLPKSLFQTHSNTLMYRLSGALRVASIALWPVTWLLRGVTRASSRTLGETSKGGWDISVRRLFQFFAEGAKEGVLSAHQDTMARNVMKLDSTSVAQVMEPLDKLEMVSVDAGVEELRRALATRPQTRALVCEGERSRIVGVLDLIEFLSAEGTPKVSEMMRPISTVPADAAAGDVFRAMQKRRRMMSVVIDSSGATLGVVTMKDLVEEVVGDIHGWAET